MSIESPYPKSRNKMKKQCPVAHMAAQIAVLLMKSELLWDLLAELHFLLQCLLFNEVALELVFISPGLSSRLQPDAPLLLVQTFRFLLFFKNLHPKIFSH